MEGKGQAFSNRIKTEQVFCFQLVNQTSCWVSIPLPQCSTLLQMPKRENTNNNLVSLTNVFSAVHLPYYYTKVTDIYLTTLTLNLKMGYKGYVGFPSIVQDEFLQCYYLSGCLDRLPGSKLIPPGLRRPEEGAELDLDVAGKSPPTVT